MVCRCVDTGQSLVFTDSAKSARKHQHLHNTYMYVTIDCTSWSPPQTTSNKYCKGSGLINIASQYINVESIKYYSSQLDPLRSWAG